MRVKSGRIYTVLNGGWYPRDPRGMVAQGNADARFSDHWVGTDPAFFQRDDWRTSRRAQSLRSATQPLLSSNLKPVFAGGRVATKSWAAFGVGNLRLHAPGVLKFLVDPPRFLDRPMHDHGAAQCGKRPFYQR